MCRKGKALGAREALVNGHTSDGREIPTKPCSIVCLKGSATISNHEERLQISEAGRKQLAIQFEIIFKSLAHFSKQFRVKKVLNYLLYKLRKFGDINHATVWQQKTLNFSGLCRRVWPAKLTNHSMHTNLEI